VVDVVNSALKQSIFMKIKHSQISLGHHLLNDTPYLNLVMMKKNKGRVVTALVAHHIGTRMW
jgi:hypothetical protein